MTSHMLASSPCTLIWHQRDLRVHDNSLYHSLTEQQPAVGVYIFNPDDFKRVPSCAEPEWDVVRTGPHQASCIIDAVADLRNSLRELGSDLIIRHGDPASVLPPLCRELSAREVRWHESAGVDEAQLTSRVYSALRGAGVSVRTDFGCTLLHPDDLPQSSQEWYALAFPRQKHQRKKDKRGGKGKSDSDAGGSGGGSARVPSGRVDISRQRLASMPPVMGDWRRAARARAKPRPPLAPPSKLSLPSALLPHAAEPVQIGAVPSLAQLMQPALPPDDGTLAHSPRGRSLFGLPDQVIRSVISSAVMLAASKVKGDEPNACFRAACAEFVPERAARRRLAEFVREGHAARADRGLADVGRHGSAKLGAALALGTLSPRQVYAMAITGGGDGTTGGGEGSSAGEAAWLGSHMEMRDFFVYSALAAGPSLFRQAGTPVAATHAPTGWCAPAAARDKWQRWATGCTGLPFVDAAMRELIATGYCSNRVRQNAASLLTKDLGIDWRAGAEWFQWLLADHDVAANWGNWAYFSGVGADPKHRHFKTISQAAKYDPAGAYVRRWCNELGSCDAEAVLRPFELAPAAWPAIPLVEPSTHIAWQDAQRLEETGRLLPPAAAPSSAPGNTGVVSTNDVELLAN